MEGIYVVAADGEIADGVDVHEALYRIGADGVAHLVRRLDQPDSYAPFEVHDATLSAGPHPTACVLWSAQHDRRVLCYPFGSSKGMPIAAADPARDNHPDEIGAIAVSVDGSRFAWVDTAVGDNSEVIRTGRLAPSGMTEQRQVPVTETACHDYVVSLTWQHTDDLVLECNGVNDGPGGYALLPAHGKGQFIDERHASPYNDFLGLVSVQGSGVIGLEGEFCDVTCDDGHPHHATRAVRWDLATGRVRNVLVIPGKGRSVSAVWGGADGLVYVTEGSNDTRLYVRMPGQRVGVRVTGLPNPYIDAAQP